MQGRYRFLGVGRLRLEVGGDSVFDYSGPFSGALMLGLRSTRPEMTSGRPLRNTAVVRYAPALRARAEALRSPPGSDHCLLLFQLAGPITTDQYKRGVQDSVTSADGQPARG